MASVTARKSDVCDAFSVGRCALSCSKFLCITIDSSISRLIAAGMKTPATATYGVLPTRVAERIHFPLATTSIFVARPDAATSSKNFFGGSDAS